MIGEEEPPQVVRQEVRAEGGHAYGAVGADIHVFGDGTPLYLLFEHRRAAERDPGWLRAQPSRMLDARAGLVGFTGRDGEFGDLVSWLNAEPGFAVRWLHGEGGQGKTRLANELAAAALAAGWKVVDAVHRTDAHPPAPGGQDLRLAGKNGVLVLVDYADRWPLSDLSWLFHNRLLRQRVPARVLLIGRSVRGWPALRGKLDRLRENIDTSDQHLAPLPEDGPARDRMFTAARDSFARHYPAFGRPDLIGPPESLGRPDFGLTLAVHMAALVAVDAAARGRRPPGDMIGCTVYLLDREHENWRQLYENADGGLDFRTDDRTMARAVFTATLAGPVDRQTAGGILARFIPEVPAEQLLADHTVCYPPADPERGNRLEPLLPDRLAEDFVALSVPGHPVTGYQPDPWTTAVPAALLTSPETGSCAPRAVALLAAAADRWPHLGDTVLYPLLRTRPDVAVDAGGSALAAIARITAIDLSVITAVESAVEARFGDRTFVGDRTPADLGAGFAAITGRHAGLAAPGASDAERAWLHLKTSRRLGVAGEAAEAAEFSGLAVEHYLSLAHRELTGSGRISGDELSALAEAVNNHPACLAAAGRWAEAGEFSADAVAIFGELTELDRANYLPCFAQALNNRALFLAKSVELVEERDGRADPVTRAEWLEQVLDHGAGALECYRELVGSDREAHRHRLAAVQSNWAGWLGQAELWKDALEASAAATARYEEVAEADPAYRRHLARELTRHADFLMQAGYHPDPWAAVVDADAGQDTQARRAWEAEVVAVSRRAVTVFRELAEAEPFAYLPDLSTALQRTSFRLTEVGCGAPWAAVWESEAAANPVWGTWMRQECGAEVLEFSRHAADIVGELAEAAPAVYREELALTLNGFAWIRATLHTEIEEAWAAAGRAVQIFEELYRDRPSTLVNAAYSVLLQVDGLRGGAEHDRIFHALASRPRSPR
ncbi:hypothetical protein GCM10022222_61640 [Amycolatopsis ultiminotia]|uniref:ATP-binding protein n=1 Tax=Amycolatopsis ultiminotia TaxID=543629 RepID=A0ABP6XNJ1_9PSEU